MHSPLNRNNWHIDSNVTIPTRFASSKSKSRIYPLDFDIRMCMSIVHSKLYVKIPHMYYVLVYVVSSHESAVRNLHFRSPNTLSCGEANTDHHRHIPSVVYAKPTLGLLSGWPKFSWHFTPTRLPSATAQRGWVFWSTWINMPLCCFEA